MNNFNDYYNYMIGNGVMPNNNPITNMNEMMNYDNSVFEKTYMNNNMPKLYKPEEGFTKGNMYINLYNQYKDYKPAIIISRNELEDLLNQIRMYNFTITDLSFYLDIHPNNPNLINLYNSYVAKEKELIEKYEKEYGPLSCNTIMPTNDYVWNNNPWPWEGKTNV